MTQQTLMKIDPATGDPKPFPSHAAQWREWHGQTAWLYNPWAEQKKLRDPGDIGIDPFGHLILPTNEALRSAMPAAPSAIDVCQPPKMIRIGADGQPAQDGAPHVAVLLPQYGLLFDTTVGKAAENHAEAVAIAEGRLICGQPGRLPEVTELQLLLRRDRHRPAIDIEFFPETPTDDWYWTATPLSSAPAYAWGVHFYDGSVYDFRRYGSGFVRAVRSVPPSQ